MKSETIYVITKCIIAIAVTTTICVLAISDGDNAGLFKIIAVSIISYLFGQHTSDKHLGKNS